MRAIRSFALLLATAGTVAACGRVVVDDRASDVDDSSASADTSGSGTGTAGGAGDGGGGGAGAGAGDGLGGAPLVDWPAGPDSEPPAESACRLDLAMTFPSSLDEGEELALVQRADGYVRLVATGSVGSSRHRAIELYEGVAWWGTTRLVEGSVVEDVGLPATEGRLPFATRGDLTVHGSDLGTTALAARTMTLDYAQLRMVTLSAATHPLPDAVSPVLAVALPGDRTALLAHGPATSPSLSTVPLADDPSVPPAVAPLASLRPCADRPVAFTAAPGVERTAIAYATDGSTCAGAAGAPDVVHTAILDTAGAVLAEDHVRVEGPIEALWSTDSSEGRWIAVRLESGAELLIGRIGDDATIEPVATIPGGADPSITSWRDGLAVVDVVDDGLRVRLVDGSGAVVEQAAPAAVDRVQGRPSIVARRGDVTVAEPRSELIVGTFRGSGAAPVLALRWFDCDLDQGPFGRRMP